MSKIEKLTTAQEAQITPFVTKYIEEFLSTERINVDKALVAIKALAKIMGTTINKDVKITVYPSITAALSANKGNISLSNMISSAGFCGGISRLKFFKDVIGVKKCAKEVDIFNDFACNTFGAWISSSEIILVDRPTEIHWQETGTKILQSSPESLNLCVLHNTSGPAIKYADGSGIYAICGIVLPKNQEYIVKDWDKLTAKDILNITNVELRQAVMRTTELDMRKALPTKQVDSWVSKKGGVYALFELDYGGGIMRKYLSGNCPSKGDNFFEAVHPECNTCKQALSWREEYVISDDYLEPELRT